MYSNFLYKMCQDFLDIPYTITSHSFNIRGTCIGISVFFLNKRFFFFNYNTSKKKLLIKVGSPEQSKAVQSVPVRFFLQDRGGIHGPSKYVAALLSGRVADPGPYLVKKVGFVIGSSLNIEIQNSCKIELSL